jgi:hypothetical protein
MDAELAARFVCLFPQDSFILRKATEIGFGQFAFDICESSSVAATTYMQVTSEPSPFRVWTPGRPQTTYSCLDDVLAGLDLKETFDSTMFSER